MLRPGRAFGPYRVEQELGRGGMAVVYRARDTRRNSIVALKVLHPHLRHERQVVARFERELRHTLHLRHPHIVPLYDSGQVGGILYLAMGYADGGTLATAIARTPPARISLYWCADVLTQVASALDYAHSQGVIHRDVKPSNILLAQGGRRALLADFGIAQAAWESRLTSSTAHIGSPSYMAPEQIAGRRLDARTDVYALGIVLYELLAGQPPFARETPLSVMYHQVHDAPPSLRSLNRALPPQVEIVVLRALEKDPAARWETAGMLAAAFRQAASIPTMPGAVPSKAAPSMARAPKISGPATTPVHRPPTAIVAPWILTGLLITFLILAALGVFTPSGLPSETIPNPTLVLGHPNTETALPTEATPSAPALAAPEDGAEFAANETITLKWGAAPLPEGWRFQVVLILDATQKQFALPAEGVTRQTTLTLPSDLKAGSYHWSVRVVEEVGGAWKESSRSETWAFTVTALQGPPATSEPTTAPPTPEPVTDPPTREPTTEAPTPEPTTAPPTPEPTPTTAPPTPEPTTEAPTPEPTTAPPTPEPTTAPPTPEPTTEAPTPEPATASPTPER